MLAMKIKVLVVGLTPEYYSSSVRRAVSDYQATMRSTNMGASFITRSIVSIFNADYLDITSDFDFFKLKNNYDVCMVALASHLGPSRDVSKLVGFLKKLDIKTVFLSGGIDAGQTGRDDVHNSVRELLDLCSHDNQLIGVRGAASALYLQRQGIRNVVPIGCPTMYSNFSGEIKPSRIESRGDIAVPFHWSIAVDLLDELCDHFLIGQDCMDEELFLDNKNFRITRNISERLGVSQKEVQKKLEYAILSNGYFPESYEAWFKIIGSQRALLSGRLHAAICGLTQGVPTVLSSWDIRTHEIVDYFKIPTVSGDVIRKKGSVLAFNSANFDRFNERQEVCWGRWSEFLRQNDIGSGEQEHKHQTVSGLNFELALHNDNELLRTASYLYPQNQSGQPGFLRRVLKSLRRNSTYIFRKFR